MANVYLVHRITYSQFRRSVQLLEFGVHQKISKNVS